ncbi:MAG TPA: Lin1244/Lin1753 domain-containing protein [Pedobacter sp.]|uniref:Lin1244/Lin1753 domain-containing protein n=1 Tax=Pedobacter sp. TaxID=1411316 RepID=UPI002D1D65E3|nr:Lin1244/Lin1753 domain-containing protein [Pedobacter sp.]HMI01832.1 Lin1244/Lin1753 domain-containing protein [Pedobacter sp.]
MARPEKDNAEYFSHDKNMRNDPKIKALRRRFPKDGYAVWNMLLEVLTESSFFMATISPIHLELMAGDFDVETKILEEIIEYCTKIELLVREDDKIYSCGLKKRLQPVLDHRNRNKEKFLRQKQKSDVVSAAETTQSKVKESKVKESNKVVEEEVGPAPENLEEKDQEEEIPEIIPDVYIDEEEKSAAVEFLKRHTLFSTIQMQQKLKPPEILKLFDTFYIQKIGFGEIKGKTGDDVVKNFYYWIPKYKNATRPDAPVMRLSPQEKASRFEELKKTYGSSKNPYT